MQSWLIHARALATLSHTGAIIASAGVANLPLNIPFSFFECYVIISSKFSYSIYAHLLRLYNTQHYVIFFEI